MEHEGKKLFECSQCDVVTLARETLKAHVEKKHSLLETNLESPGHEDEDMRVDEPEMTDESTFEEPEKTLDERMESPSTQKEGCVMEERTYNCGLCGFGSGTPGGLKRHMQTRHEQNLLSNNGVDEKTLLCDSDGCGFRAESRRKLRLHGKTVHGGKVLVRCPWCEFETVYRSHLRSHAAKIHGMKLEESAPVVAISESEKENRPQNSMLCACGFSTTDAPSMKDHVKTHIQYLGTDMKSVETAEGKTAPVLAHPSPVRDKCPACERRPRFLKYHLKRWHPGLTLAKNECGAVARKECEPLLKCEYCSFTSRYLGNLKRHLAERHPETTNGQENKYRRRSSKAHAAVEDQETLSCGKCDFRTSYEFNMQRHVQKVHGEDQETLGCGKCDFKTFYVFNMQRHIQKVHGEGRTSLAASTLECDQCPHVAPSRAALAAHTERFHTQLQCLVCSFSAATDRELMAHVDTAHGELDMTTSQSPMQSEGDTSDPYEDTGVPPDDSIVPPNDGTGVPASGGKKKKKSAQCPLCDFTGVVTSSVHDHIKKEHPESVDSAYACPECSFTAGKVSAVMRHVKLEHDGREVFNCKKCDFSSVDKGYFRKHEMTKHDKDEEEKESMEIECMKCDFTCLGYAAMDVHVKSGCAGEKKAAGSKSATSAPSRCPICGEVVSQETSLTKHLMSRHVEEQ